MRGLRFLGVLAWALQVVAAVVGSVWFSVSAFGVGMFLFHGEATWRVVPVLDVAIGVILMIRLGMLLTESQQGDLIDIQKLLFLPVRLSTLFWINLIVRNAGLVATLVVPALVCLCAAMAYRHGPQMLLGIPIGLVTYAALAAWFDCAREWLLSLGQVNTKRILNIALVAVSLAMGVSGLAIAWNMIQSETSAPKGVSEAKLEQMKEELGDAWQPPQRDSIDRKPAIMAINRWIPIGWFPLALLGLTRGEYRMALIAAGAFSLAAVAGVALNYRLIVQKYHGAPNVANGEVRKRKTRTRRASRLTALKIPAVGQEASAYVGLAALNYARTWSVRTTTIAYIIAAVFVTIVAVVAELSRWQGQWWGNVVPFIVAACAVFFSIGLSSNLFGQDRSGFQALVLLPLSRYVYLASKNGVLFAIIFGQTLLLVLASALLLRTHPAVTTAVLLHTMQAQLSVAIVGNFLSVVFPFRLKNGVLDEAAEPFAAMLPTFLLMLACPLVFAPMTFTALIVPVTHWWSATNGPWLALASASGWLGIALCAYAITLPATAGLMARRETRMLEVLSSDRE